MGKTKKQLEQIVLKKEKKVRQYRSNQGRSPENMESSYKVMAISMGAIVISILILIIDNLINA
jgi:hypothetical protein